jgi:hypothetical protein
MEDAYDESYPDAYDDQVGTMDVQILLSWFFESADPAEFEVQASARGEAA